MTEIAGIIGAISGGLSFLGIIYMLGYWKGKVDTDLGEIKRSFQQYPPAEIALMAKTIWDIYVVDALAGRPDLASQHSAYKLSSEGEGLIPDDLKQELNDLPHNPHANEAIASGWLVVKYLGMERISLMAKERQLSVQEAIAILSTYLDDKAQTAG